MKLGNPTLKARQKIGDKNFLLGLYRIQESIFLVHTCTTLSKWSGTNVRIFLHPRDCVINHFLLGLPKTENLLTFGLHKLLLYQSHCAWSELTKTVSWYSPNTNIMLDFKMRNNIHVQCMLTIESNTFSLLKKKTGERSSAIKVKDGRSDSMLPLLLNLPYPGILRHSQVQAWHLAELLLQCSWDQTPPLCSWCMSSQACPWIHRS